MYECPITNQCVVGAAKEGYKDVSKRLKGCEFRVQTAATIRRVVGTLSAGL